MVMVFISLLPLISCLILVEVHFYIQLSGVFAMSIILLAVCDDVCLDYSLSIIIFLLILHPLLRPPLLVYWESTPNKLGVYWKTTPNKVFPISYPWFTIILVYDGGLKTK